LIVSGISAAVRAAVRTLKVGLRTSKAFAREPWAPAGLLAEKGEDELGMPRYANIPPEAFPILRSRQEGIHYALWLDDPAANSEPLVVEVRPRSGLPETVRIVCRSAAEFLQVIETSGTGRRRSREWTEKVAERAALERAKRVRYPTIDGLGVLCPPEAAGERPTLSEVGGWTGPEWSRLFRGSVERWLKEGAPGLALAVARDLLITGRALQIDGFERSLAQVYHRLGRTLLARVTLSTYDWHRRMA
jgi:hypothetical protein